MTIHSTFIPVGVCLQAVTAGAVIYAGNLDLGSSVIVAAAVVAAVWGALALPHCSWRSAVFPFLLLLGGEIVGVLATIDRVVTAREGNASGIAAANAATDQARGRVGSIEANLADHDREARAAIALRGCASECRGLLERTQNRLSADLAEARAAAALAPVARAVSPTAALLGLLPGHLDLLMASLGSVCINGMGCFLIYLGAHTPASRRLPTPPEQPTADALECAPHEGPLRVVEDQQPTMPSNVVPIKRLAPPSSDVAAYFADRLLLKDGSSVALVEMVRDYREWCTERGEEPLSPQETVMEFARLVKRLRLKTETKGKIVHCVNVKLGTK